MKPRSSASANTANYVVNFVEPAFLGRNVEFSFSSQLQERNSDTNEQFDATIGQFRPGHEFPVSENGRFGLYYSAKYLEMDNYIGGNAGGILATEAALSKLWSSAIGYEYTYDTRRTGLNPNAGVLLSFGQEFGGLGGDRDFIKTSARVIGQTKIMNEEVTLRATLEGGALHFSGSQESIALERFSGQVMRGFEPNGIGPTETTGTSVDHLGGDFFAVLKLEAEFPLGLPDEYGISGGAFYDIGSVWGVDSTNATGTMASTGFKDRHVVGFSLFWESPFGPLRMNFSHALKKEANDREQQFDLTVRTDF